MIARLTVGNLKSKWMTVPKAHLLAKQIQIQQGLGSVVEEAEPEGIRLPDFGLHLQLTTKKTTQYNPKILR